MAVATSWLVKRSIHAETKIDKAVVLYLLVTMASMFGGAVLYFSSPGITSLVEAIALNALLMTGGVIFILRFWGENVDEELNKLAVVNTDSSNSTLSSGPTPRGYFFRGAAISLILLNEFLMGWAFVLVSGSPFISSGSLPTVALSTFNVVVGSDWFIFTMALEMILSVYFLRKELPSYFVAIFLLQSVVMIFAPTAIQNSDWVTASIYLGGVAMIGLLIYCYEFLFKHRAITNVVRAYLLALLGIYALMMAGLFVWLVQGSPFLFVLSIVSEMVIYFDVLLLGKGSENSKSSSWMLSPWWVFGFLGLTFVAEYFMGALFDIQYYGIGFVTGISLVPITGSIVNQIGAVFFNFITYFGTVTGSSWFLIMMGAEMGALVVFKIRITRELETRIRLVLVIAAYFIYSIFLPSFVFGSSAAYIPFLGWSMGVGTAGAVAPVFLGAILGTYLITAVLSFLFGSRQTCSVFCTAALMYQGTFYDSMKDFNRTSKLGKTLLTSRISNLYKMVASIAIGSMIVAAALSYLNSIGVISFSFFGTDIAYFLYVFYFNFLWYVIFITIPFVGTYGCVTTGMCHIGLFNQFVSRFGLFRLKVKDPNVCVTCQTKDCAKACPVGLTDLPGSFIKSGQFRSHKCIGVGDCVSACPYQNEYIYDVRGWLRERLGRGSSGGLGARGTRLPVISGPGNALFDNQKNSSVNSTS
jgi:polyferredoxin